MSTRKAAAMAGVSHTWVADMRKWKERGSDPAELEGVLGGTIEGVVRYLEMADDIERRRDALTLAADRLDQMADQMRREATSPRAGIDEVLDGAAHVQRILDAKKKGAAKGTRE